MIWEKNGGYGTTTNKARPSKPCKTRINILFSLVCRLTRPLFEMSNKTPRHSRKKPERNRKTSAQSRSERRAEKRRQPRRAQTRAEGNRKGLTASKKATERGAQETSGGHEAKNRASGPKFSPSSRSGTRRENKARGGDSSGKAFRKTPSRNRQEQPSIRSSADKTAAARHDRVKLEIAVRHGALRLDAATTFAFYSSHTAHTRAGRPAAPSIRGQATKTTAPAGGTLSKLDMTSTCIWPESST